MYRSQHNVKHLPATRQGAGCELLVVEGDSAAQSVAAIRNPATQGILPLQGKPINAWRASSEKVLSSPLYGQLADALGLRDAVTPLAENSRLRYSSVVLLFDPDADGIHIGALVLLYLMRWQPALIAAGAVHMVRPPMYAFAAAEPDTGEVQTHFAYTPEHAGQLKTWLAEKDRSLMSQLVYRGLGSIPPDVLRELCVHPQTRHAHVVTAAQMQAVVDVFGN